MLDTIIPLLILSLTILGITKLNKETRPTYIKNYSFRKDFIRENKKLMFWFLIILLFSCSIFLN